jgi:hypothetical protein
MSKVPRLTKNVTPSLAEANGWRALFSLRGHNYLGRVRGPKGYDRRAPRRHTGRAPRRTRRTALRRAATQAGTDGPPPPKHGRTALRGEGVAS